MANFSDIGSRVQEETALALAQALPGGQLKKQVARLCGRSFDYIQECCLTGRRMAPIDVLLAALDLTSHPALYELLRTEGHHMVPRLEEPASEDRLLLLLARQGGAFGQVADVFSRILDPSSEGGRGITAPEKAEARAALSQMQRRAAQIEAALDLA